MSIIKQIIVDELVENCHVIDFEIVLFIALKKIAKDNKKYHSGVIASCVVDRIATAEKESLKLMNPEVVKAFIEE